MAESERPSHDQEFVEYVVKSIVDHPDDVQVQRVIDEMGVLLTLTVNPEDMGQVIGRQGATAKSIRTLLRVIGAKNNARVNLKINEPEGSQRGAERREEAAPQPEKPSVEEAIDGLNL
ncbi:MAG: KH domain-containing protein [Candidatus Andersenbacteria bacterium]|nr:KH domain-containing protein [Candidatus Andersenbacteria bacterium]